MKFRLPKIQEGLMTATARSMRDPDWIEEMFKGLQKYDSTMALFMVQIMERHGCEAGACALTVYRILNSQLEANEMDAMFK